MPGRARGMGQECQIGKWIESEPSLRSPFSDTYCWF